MAQPQRVGMTLKVMRHMQQVNSLLCNIGLHVTCRTRWDDGTEVWLIEMYDGDGVYEGTHSIYKHRRSMYRAAWRLYRQQTGN